MDEMAIRLAGKGDRDDADAVRIGVYGHGFSTPVGPMCEGSASCVADRLEVLVLHNDVYQLVIACTGDRLPRKCTDLQVDDGGYRVIHGFDRGKERWVFAELVEIYPPKI